MTPSSLLRAKSICVYLNRMPNEANGDSLRNRVMQQLDALQKTILELLDDAEAGRQIRTMFESRSARATTEKPKANPARTPKPRAVEKTNATDSQSNGVAHTKRTRPESSELAEKILSVLSAAKKGLKVRELKEKLPEVKAGPLTYQLEKLLSAKQIRKRGKTSKTTYSIAPA